MRRDGENTISIVFCLPFKYIENSAFIDHQSFQLEMTDGETLLPKVPVSVKISGEILVLAANIVDYYDFKSMLSTELGLAD